MKNLFYYILLIVCIHSFSSCRHKEDYETEGYTLMFSSEVIFFDTIFTSLGSTYKKPVVHNPYNKTLLISSIRICGGENSPYRINIDGDTNVYFKNIEIAAKDFIHVFIRVTINPTNENQPFLIEDSIEFNTNGKKQYLKLEAFGQNAYYHLPNKTLTLPDGSLTEGFYAGCSAPWKTDKPHVIYGTCLIEDSVWKITAGTKIHLNTNGQIAAGKGGCIEINGEKENPVIFTGIRKDEHYSQLSGQWKSIWLSKESGKHKIDWAVIQNGSIGLIVDSNADKNTPLEISNTIIKNMSHAGIEAKTADIKGENLVVSYCKTAVLSLQNGGIYEFLQCTFANYWGSNFWDNSDFRKETCVKITEPDNPVESFSINFSNCIIYGGLQDELFIRFSPSFSSLSFQNCFIKITDISFNFFHNCIFNKTPFFEDTKTNDLRPMSNSPFIGKGNIQTGESVPFDLNGNKRKIPPAIGAYEYEQ